MYITSQFPSHQESFAGLHFEVYLTICYYQK